MAKKKGNIYPKNERLYLNSKKHTNAVCPGCGLVFINGTWKRGRALDEFSKKLCPACRRIEDGYFSGILTIKSDLLKVKKDEIINLVKNKERQAQENNPLRRVGKIEEISDNEIIIYTTFEHLATSIGKALKSAYKGNLDIQYKEGEKSARVYWEK